MRSVQHGSALGAQQKPVYTCHVCCMSKCLYMCKHEEKHVELVHGQSVGVWVSCVGVQGPDDSGRVAAVEPCGSCPASYLWGQELEEVVVWMDGVWWGLSRQLVQLCVWSIGNYVKVSHRAGSFSDSIQYLEVLIIIVISINLDIETIPLQLPQPPLSLCPWARNKPNS